MAEVQSAQLLRRLGVFDLTLIAIGCIIGSGIFRTPSVVAQRVHSPVLILACWALGGLVASIGTMVFAELASRRPLSGGLYAYLRDAYNPLVGFIVVWVALTMAFTGSTGASAVLFADYALRLVPLGVSAKVIAVAVLLIVTVVNVIGVSQGTLLQNILVGLKVAGVCSIIAAAGFVPHVAPVASAADTPMGFAGLLVAMGSAMLPVFFTYQGFQSAAYAAAETRSPGTTVTRGLLFGFAVVVMLYLVVNAAFLIALGPANLAATKTPAADIMTAAFGSAGATIVSLAIAASTLGFISTATLLAPRAYFQLAADHLFFKQIGYVWPRTHTPAIAVMAHGTIAAIVAASGSYEQIINWVALPTWFLIMLGAIAIFIYRKRDAGLPRPGFMVPFHPWSTSLVIVTIVLVEIAVAFSSPLNSLYSALVVMAGVVFFYVWKSAHA